LLRNIYVPKRDEVTGKLRRLHNGGASSFVRLNKCSDDEIMENKMDEACGTHGGEEKIIRDFGGDT
jgi:hypothetical protein